MKRTNFLIAAFVGCTSVSALANVIHVPADYPDIQSAVDAAVTGDEIIVGPGVYTGGSDVDYGIVISNKDIYLHSSDGPSKTFIDGENTRRCMFFNEGVTSNTTVEGFTFQNGYGAGALGMGGAMYVYLASPNITNCVFINNYAPGYGADGGGGAVSMRYCYSPTIFTACQFQGNTSNSVGGALSARFFSSASTLVDCTFCDNSPEHIYGPWNDSGGNSFSEVCQIIDCNGNGIDDFQDIANGTSSDCNNNGIPDECDVASVTLVDGAVQWTVENGGNDHWYGIVYVGNGSCWNDVRVEAESYGGHLATITSQEEQDFLEANIYDSSVWMSIGGYQDLNDPDYSEPGGGWKWVTGEPMDYTHWYSGSWGEMPWDDNPPTHHWMQVGMTWWNLMWKTTVECSDESHAYIIEYDNLNGTSEDCNGNGIPDECELESNDCNNNGILDECDIANGTSPDVNPTDGVPDECQGIPNGACCIGSQCIMGTEISCTSNGGDYLGNGIACSSDSCGTSGTGACCLLGTCIEATLENCFVSGGSFAGVFATCNETNCPSSCSGDVNNDGTVQIDDLLLLIGAWGACP